MAMPPLPNQPHESAPVLTPDNRLTREYFIFFRSLLSYMKAVEERETAGGI